MEVLEFRKITTEDEYDDYYNDNSCWSRVYEYPLVLKTIKKLYKKGQLIHNTSWGFSGVHILFKEKLEEMFEVEHSDIKASKLEKTFVYDITKRNDSLKEKYDILINVSTLEEVKGVEHKKIFFNLLEQLKPGGFLVCTFDLPGLQLESFEELFSQKIIENDKSLNGKNSKLKNTRYSNLNCGLMVVKK